MRYTIEYRDDDAILVCRVYGFMDEEMGKRFGKDLLGAQLQAREKSGCLRCLIDNREGRVAAPAVAAALAEQFRSVTRPGDRSAILVANSLNKIQAKRSVTTEHEIFVSEEAAVTWLTAYASTASAA